MNDTPVPILMYHSIAAAPNDATRELSVGPEAFAEQMALLGDRGSPRSTRRRWRRVGAPADRCRGAPC